MNDDEEAVDSAAGCKRVVFGLARALGVEDSVAGIRERRGWLALVASLQVSSDGGES